ncbi:MAG: methyltransferase domain-containing protein [Actinomycetia bacterium]|nr:methyltransferase domain-containing protein [Actinomycetes bacterium]
MAGSRTTPRRHPSAGNLSSRPTLVGDEGSPGPLVPASFPHGDEGAAPAVRLGPDLDNETLAKLLGPLEGARVLDLGCGSGSASVAMARAGARVIAVDSSTARLTRARTAAEVAEVRVEFHHSDLADLAFVRADSIDAVLAVYSLAQVQDLSRVFRQLHRVLSPDAPVVLSVPHPMSLMLEWDPEEQSSPWLARTAWSDAALAWRVGGDEGATHVHQVSELFTSLQRSNFAVDTLMEPVPETDAVGSPHRGPLDDWVPSTLVMRARKQGI